MFDDRINYFNSLVIFGNKFRVFSYCLSYLLESLYFIFNLTIFLLPILYIVLGGIILSSNMITGSFISSSDTSFIFKKASQKHKLLIVLFILRNNKVYNNL